VNKAVLLTEPGVVDTAARNRELTGVTHQMQVMLYRRAVI
jgi:hypothetical protein